MGRWKRKKHIKIKGKQHGKESTSDKKENNPMFGRRDRKLLLHYLKEYKELADWIYAKTVPPERKHDKHQHHQQHHQHHQQQQQPASPSYRSLASSTFGSLLWGASASKVEEHQPQEEETVEVQSKDDKKSKLSLHSCRPPFVIGGHTFPLLTEDVLMHPYLALPKALSGKQRRMVHELCTIDVPLFHCGVTQGGEGGYSRHEDRYIIISIYSDGFLHCPDYVDRTKSERNQAPVGNSFSKLFPCSVRAYKPWIYRKANRLLEDHPKEEENDRILSSSTDTATTYTTSSESVVSGISSLSPSDVEDQQGHHNEQDPAQTLEDSGDGGIPSHDSSSSSSSTTTMSITSTPTSSSIHSNAETENDNETPLKSNKTDPNLWTQRNLDAIQALINQPGDCLRNGLDLIDIPCEKEQDQPLKDLSSIPPPLLQEDTAADKIDDYLLVDSPATMKQCLRELEECNPTEIAFDLEAYNRSQYTQMTCLIQLTSCTTTSTTSDTGATITTRQINREYVIDTLAPGVWDLVSGLGPLFADPSIVKIGHSVGGLDVQCLHRDFGIFVVNAFDTYEAALKLADIRQKGLAKVCEHYGMKDSKLYMSLKDKHQKMDWRQRPLTPSMIQYGRFDIRYLCDLRLLMMRDLVRNFERVNPSTKKTPKRGTATNGFHKVRNNKNMEIGQMETTLGSLLRKFNDEDDDIVDGKEEELIKDHDDGCNSGTSSSASSYASPRNSLASSNSDEFFHDARMEMSHSASLVANYEALAARTIDVVDPTESDGSDGQPQSEQQEESEQQQEVEQDVHQDTSQLFDAPRLRMCPDLMSMIRKSQDSCKRSLWKLSKIEKHLNNKDFIALKKRAKFKEIPAWTTSQLQLYDQLAAWRLKVASQEGCLPDFVCPLDLLAYIAYRRPTSKQGIQQLSYILPELWEENECHSGRSPSSSSTVTPKYVDEVLLFVHESWQQDVTENPEVPKPEAANYPSYKRFLEGEEANNVKDDVDQPDPFYDSNGSRGNFLAPSNLIAKWKTGGGALLVGTVAVVAITAVVVRRGRR